MVSQRSAIIFTEFNLKALIMLKNIISLIAIIWLIAIRYIEIVHQAETDLYLNLLLWGIAIGVSSDEFIKLFEYWRTPK